MRGDAGTGKGEKRWQYRGKRLCEKRDEKIGTVKDGRASDIRPDLGGNLLSDSFSTAS